MGEFLIIFLSYIDFLSINNSGISIEKLQTNGYMNLRDGKMFKIYIELKTEETYLGKSIDKELKDEIGKFIKL